MPGLLPQDVIDAALGSYVEQMWPTREEWEGPMRWGGAKLTSGEEDYAKWEAEHGGPGSSLEPDAGWFLDIGRVTRPEGVKAFMRSHRGSRNIEDRRFQSQQERIAGMLTEYPKWLEGFSGPEEYGPFLNDPGNQLPPEEVMKILEELTLGMK